ncbi:hypothetical protein PVAND_016843 [Polypedilum vanderplanki]|uniref:OBP47-like domain-containing protein n=1 Tax=Polypedilum vanderplanki TaxID=319348 RepID=A0A9J6BH00_POLVA|nr:hypothetical protein PVAND_016843 [Polypedilum vanderplanki]
MEKYLIKFAILSLFCAHVVTQMVCSDNPPSGKDIRECCLDYPRVFDTHLNSSCITRYARNTQRQLQDLEPGETPKGNCVLECIANQTRIYKGRGIIDTIALKRLYMNSVSGDRDWGNIIVKAVDLCVNETRIMFNDMKTNYKEAKTTFVGEVICHPVSGYIFGCLQTELFRRCTNMTESSECEALQQYASACHLSIKYS